ncbi:MAG: nuclear transport factor 2 family protein [Patulibacter sp.]|nr:nuclear transport factor 2 family protein [Patulibacter sp.]
MTVLTAADRLEIIELQSIYAWAIDQKQFDLLPQAFTDDAVVRYPLAAPVRGVAALARYVEAFHASHDGTQHLIANPWIVADGDDVIFRSYVTVTMKIADFPGGEHLRGGGYYVDRVVRTDAGWRVADRDVQNVWRDGNMDVVTESRAAVARL